MIRFSFKGLFDLLFNAADLGGDIALADAEDFADLLIGGHRDTGASVRDLARRAGKVVQSLEIVFETLRFAFVGDAFGNLLVDR